MVGVEGLEQLRLVVLEPDLEQPEHEQRAVAVAQGRTDLVVRQPQQFFQNQLFARVQIGVVRVAQSLQCQVHNFFECDVPEFVK